MADDDLMIETRGLTRRFGAVTAVAGLDLAVRRGELFGLVGPNGAGKTTAMRLLVGALAADAGQARIDGLALPAGLEQVRRRLGYVAQRFSLYGDLTVAENLALSASLFGVAAAAAAERAARLLALTDLTAARDRLADRLSGGMKQKLALACALVHEPRLLLLDEPTNGVDPVARREFWRLLTGLRAEGVTILVSTAYLDEAELCGRVGFMRAGRLLGYPRVGLATLVVLWLPAAEEGEPELLTKLRNGFEGVERGFVNGHPSALRSVGRDRLPTGGIVRSPRSGRDGRA